MTDKLWEKSVKGMSNATLTSYLKGVRRGSGDTIQKPYFASLFNELDQRKEMGAIRSDAGQRKPQQKKKESFNPFNARLRF